MKLSRYKLLPVLCGTILLCCSCGSKDTSIPNYSEVINNAFGLSGEEFIDKYGLNSDEVQTKEDGNWTYVSFPETEKLIDGYSASPTFSFWNDGLDTADYIVYYAEGDEGFENGYNAMTDIYTAVAGLYGEPGDDSNPQEPLNRFKDFSEFSDTISPSIESDGLYIESDTWYIPNEEERDIRLEMTATFFDGGASSIEVKTYDWKGMSVYQNG